ncbi:ATP-binding protein [Cereibacter johrii]|uniref:ATP-binding protein n=1 Tax=Cereibacter johrii TaxID=445629 RepID=UPI002B2617C2|nr:ATP-binding protein [Cereibacter johrii]MEA5160718.1 ATP-binding protein [Cereibacter johrii]
MRAAASRIVECILDAKGGWKDLNRKTLKAMGYPISDSSRLTQSALGDKVTTVARAQGIVGVHYDEAQHLFRGRSDDDVRIILDAFKTMTKSSEWPLMLFLSGVPELADYISKEFQLFRLKEHVEFTDIDLDSDEQGTIAGDYTIIHEIVGSYAITAGLTIDESIGSFEFYHRLATAAAFRWGLLIEITFKATQEAATKSTRVLSRDDFVTAWARKAKCNLVSTPFTLDAYDTIFRREKPFCHSIPQ